MIPDLIEDAFEGYVTCALWSSHTEDDPEGGSGEPLDLNHGPDDVAHLSKLSMLRDLVSFVVDNFDDCETAAMSSAYAWGSVGHDFWLTRNRHGAGFWDRGLGVVGERLTEASHAYGETFLYLSDNGEVSEG